MASNDVKIHGNRTPSFAVGSATTTAAAHKFGQHLDPLGEFALPLAIGFGRIIRFNETSVVKRSTRRLHNFETERLRQFHRCSHKSATWMECTINPLRRLPTSKKPVIEMPELSFLQFVL